MRIRTGRPITSLLTLLVPVAPTKSQRYLEGEATEAKNDIFVPQAMQKFIANRMSELISNSIKFVETSEDREPVVVDISGGVRLLSDAPDYIKDEEPATTLPQIKPPATKSRKRKIEDALNTTSPESVVVDADHLRSKAETKAWTNRPTAATFHYKAKKGNLYLVEPETEFTAARKKNNWDESKIRSRV
jgi:hypothetical protein